MVSYLETPLVPSLYLGHDSGMKVWMKLETAQPSGSFKSRGLGNLVAKSIAKYPGENLHFFCASGGNAGLACAHAAATYHQPCTVCLPLTTDPAMVRRIERAGASVVAHGTSIAEADIYMRTQLMPALKDSRAIYAHPYDDPLVWEGNASMGTEIAEQCTARNFKPAAIIVAVGGGGMLAGLVHGIREAGWTDVPIVAVETRGCAALHESLKQKKQVNITRPSTVATSLATINVCQEALDYANGIHPISSIVISDKMAVDACLQFAEDHKILVEPACGTALAPLYSGLVAEYLGLSRDANVVVVVCGGTNVSWSRLETWSKELQP